MIECARKVILRNSTDKMERKRRKVAKQNVRQNKVYPIQNDEDLPATKCDSWNKGESQLRANNPKIGERSVGYFRHLFHKFLLRCCISGEISDSESCNNRLYAWTQQQSSPKHCLTPVSALHSAIT
ncbi:uncharacterized protein LOC111631897 [Centruroides sculpturatus]|uniref:uncharacterized protein LOC111631897 n=1 Tax=Centruroides sculpturatus TaxID=218467 RepID=UPI000C6E74A6|nr:uncharacterized protein LOC111631897 [Centruroides sculpturatus]